ncbi:hypothetical protein ZHAS_00006839 [Anopheles sinensis]|uniref:Cytochrome P450 n=1 Tax=Anopheles sinensis TaxID=74873 RepID=A0A084VN58_ANOSI|nr:hypothetical protein ZHAS_00006839 [Anopheles sinensis]
MELAVAVATYLVAFVATLCLAVYLYVGRKYSFWKRHHVPYVQPELPFGNFKEMGKSIHPAHLSKLFYDEFKGKGRGGFVGLYIFLQPVLLVTDLRLAKRILIEDFHHFPDRGVYFNEKDDPLSAHLFSLEGKRWKDLRGKISPTFTSGRMKAAFPMVLKIGEQFCEYLRDECSGGKVLEVRDLMARFTTDVIGTYAFGLECNSFRDPQNEFRRIGRKHFDTPRNHPLKVFVMKTFRGLANAMGLKLLHDDVAAFFSGVIRQTVAYRERHETERRNDFLDLLISLKNTGMLESSGEIIGRLTLDEIAAQAFIFFTAGFETSSSAMTYTLYEMALNEEVQRKARDCVMDALEKHDGSMTYESFKNMLYLDQCIYETLRKYPPVAILERTVAKPYKIPDTNVTLHRGMKIMIPAYAIHHDEEFYPDPSTYDPGRFTPDRMARRDPCAYLPFGEGPRICIGLRFGMMQARIGLALLLKHFKVVQCDETDVPLTYSTRAFVLTPINGVRLRLEKYEHVPGIGMASDKLLDI